MIQECNFKPNADIIETQQGMATSIPDALDYGRIQDTSVPSQYNCMKGPEEVGSRISEPFDVIEFDRTYTRIRKSINDSEYQKKKEEEVKKQ